MKKNTIISIYTIATRIALPSIILLLVSFYFMAINEYKPVFAQLILIVSIIEAVLIFILEKLRSSFIKEIKIAEWVELNY